MSNLEVIMKLKSIFWLLDYRMISETYRKKEYR
jgi:hypothetical protein